MSNKVAYYYKHDQVFTDHAPICEHFLHHHIREAARAYHSTEAEASKALVDFGYVPHQDTASCMRHAQVPLEWAHALVRRWNNGDFGSRYVYSLSKTCPDDTTPAQFIVVAGNPVEGFAMYGPYASREDAISAAQSGLDDAWWIAELEPAGVLA